MALLRTTRTTGARWRGRSRSWGAVDAAHRPRRLLRRARFGDFAAHLEIPRAVLTSRLVALVRRACSPSSRCARPRRVRADRQGPDLWPVVRSLLVWGDEHYSEIGPRASSATRPTAASSGRTGSARPAGPWSARPTGGRPRSRPGGSPGQAGPGLGRAHRTAPPARAAPINRFCRPHRVVSLAGMPDNAPEGKRGSLPPSSVRSSTGSLRQPRGAE